MRRQQVLTLILLIVTTVCLMLGFLLPGIGQEHLPQQIGLACIPFVLGSVGTALYWRRVRRREMKHRNQRIEADAVTPSEGEGRETE